MPTIESLMALEQSSDLHKSPLTPLAKGCPALTLYKNGLIHIREATAEETSSLPGEQSVHVVGTCKSTSSPERVKRRSFRVVYRNTE